MVTSIDKPQAENAATSIEEDCRWIRETLEGNPEAFGHLIQKHTPLLTNMACRILKNPNEAEDVVQDSFVDAFRHLAEFKQNARFSTWMYTIVLNRIRNILRHAKVLHISSLDIRRETSDGEYTVEVKENGPSMDETLQNKFELQAMRNAAATLPGKYLEIYSLYYYQNLSIAEIAAQLNRPAVTIKVYLHRARKMLCLALQKSTNKPLPLVRADRTAVLL